MHSFFSPMKKKKNLFVCLLLLSFLHVVMMLRKKCFPCLCQAPLLGWVCGGAAAPWAGAGPGSLLSFLLVFFILDRPELSKQNACRFLGHTNKM